MTEAVCRHCGRRIISVEMTGVAVWVHPHEPSITGSYGNQWCWPGRGPNTRALPALEVEA